MRDENKTFVKEKKAEGFESAYNREAFTFWIGINVFRRN